MNKRRGLKNMLAVKMSLLILTCGLFVPGEWVTPRAVSAQEITGTLRVDVELATVEVVVMDKKGKPVQGLKKENFQLFEDGKPQTIATFDSVMDKPGNQPAPTSLADIDDAENQRGKVVLILFDDSHIGSSQLKFARDAAEKYVQQHMRPWDLFGVATYGQSLKIVQNFSHDAAKVIEAIRKPATSYTSLDKKVSSGAAMGQPSDEFEVPGSARRGQQQQRSPMDMQELKFRSLSLFRTLGYLSNSMAMVKGRKSIIMFSEDFSIPADIQNDFNSLVEIARRSNVSFFTLDSRGVGSSMGMLMKPPLQTAIAQKKEQPSLLSSLGTMLTGLMPTFGILPESPVALWTSAYLQQTGGQTGGSGGGGAPSGGGGSAGGGTAGGGTAGGGTAGGGTSGGSTGGTTGGTTTGNTTGSTGKNTTTNTDYNTNSGSRNNGMEPNFSAFEQQTMTSNILRSLASETNGLAIFNTNNLNERLNDVDLELSNYYILGYFPNNTKRSNKIHKIEVKTELKDVTLKHRGTIQEVRPPELESGSKGEKALSSAMASPSLLTQIPLSFRPVYFYDSPQLARVPVVAKIQHGILEAKKKGNFYVVSFNVMGVAFNEDGSTAARFSEAKSYNLTAEQAERFKNQDLVYLNYWKLRPGKYRMKMAVADEKGKAGTSELNMEIPAQTQTGWSTSTLILSQDLQQLPELIQNMQTRLLDETDPMIFRGFQIRAPLVPQYDRQRNIVVFYRIYGKEAKPGPGMVAKLELSDEKGQKQAGPTIPLNDLIQATGKGELTVGFSFPVKDYQPGKYKLTVETINPEANQKVVTESDLTLM
jgi:VWFA-related protein